MMTSPQLFDFVLRLTVILGVGLIISAVLRRASAAERHLVLLGIVLSSLLLPAGLLLIPRFSIAVPVSGPPSVFQSAVVALASQPSTSAVTASPAVQEHRGFPMPGWVDCLMILAVAGAFAQAVRMAFGFLALHRIQRQSMPFAVPAPAALVARRIAGLGFLPPVRLAANVSIPFLRGWRRPCLILPAGATDWPENKLVMVLAHEMAHIRRRDHQWQPVLLLFRFLYWWHPLARMALVQILQERERACDDIVLSGDVRASDYAQLLVETAAASPLSAVALAMAAPSRIAGRVRKILSNNQRRAPASRLLLGLVSTVALALLAAVTVTGLHAGEKPHAAASPSANPPQIEIEFKLLQISEETYQQNREVFDSAIKASTDQDVQKFLRALNHMEGIELVSAPKVTTRSGQRATIEIVREFPFPDAFGKDRMPTSFANRDLGPTFEVEPSETNGKIRVSGTFFFTEFLGFVESGEKGPQTPAFQTREAHFLREQASGIPSLLLVPWQSTNSSILPGIQQKENSTPPTPTTQRLILFLNATLVEDPAAVMKRNKALLDETILHDLDYRDAPLGKVIDDLFAELSRQNDASKLLFFNKCVNDPVPKFTFKARAVSANDLLAEMDKQTAYAHQFDGLRLAIFPREPAPSGKIPYGIPAPNKPGFVTSPYAPKSGYVDLRGFARGAEVKCPYTEKPFLVP